MGPSAAAAAPPPGDERDELGDDSLEDAGEREEVLLTVRSMAVAVSSLSLSVDCSDFKDPGVLANNGFLRLSRFRFLVGGGKIVGFGCIGFNKDPAICGL